MQAVTLDIIDPTFQGYVPVVGRNLSDSSLPEDDPIYIPAYEFLACLLELQGASAAHALCHDTGVKWDSLVELLCFELWEKPGVTVKAPCATLPNLLQGLVNLYSKLGGAARYRAVIRDYLRGAHWRTLAARLRLSAADTQRAQAIVDSIPSSDSSSCSGAEKRRLTEADLTPAKKHRPAAPAKTPSKRRGGRAPAALVRLEPQVEKENQLLQCVQQELALLGQNDRETALRAAEQTLAATTVTLQEAQRALADKDTALRAAEEALAEREAALGKQDDLGAAATHVWAAVVAASQQVAKVRGEVMMRSSLDRPTRADFEALGQGVRALVTFETKLRGALGLTTETIDLLRKQLQASFPGSSE
jgi:hypothetical protein